ncbi:MAG: MBL fold metallo-hydrolase [Oscillospiraceae bacterium]|nr:MBL fold metallo-hydrolase [Oscillospiraceae bacterium]
MKIKYLGTAASECWPALFCKCTACEAARKLGGKNIRSRSQSIVDGKLLIDMPADSYYHSLKFEVDFSAIEHILITHSHEDHFNFMDFLLKAEPYAFNGKALQIKVYGNKTVCQILYDAIQKYGPQYAEKFIKPVEASAFQSFEAGGYLITPLPADHTKGEDCFMYIIEKDSKALLYAHDTGEFPKSAMEYIRSKHFDAVSLDCTFLLKDNSEGHMGLPNNIKIKNKMLEYGCADKNTKFIINHFSHNGEVLHDELEQIASKEGFLTAYDGFDLDF